MVQAWHLVSRPEGTLTMENVELRDVPLPPLAEGQIHVRNHWLSVDPITRLRMRGDYQGAQPPFALGEPIGGVATGVVVESRSPLFSPGDRVKHQLGWRDEAVGAAELFGKLPDIDMPEQYFMHYMGVVGLTAWSGLVKVAEARAGDVAFISAAGGGVGSAAVQIAKILGLRVIGSAGGAEKCAFVRSIGADAVIDYKAPGGMEEKLRQVAPEGIDVYLDNVGGDHLDAALGLANTHARFAISGTVGNYDNGEAATLRNFSRVVGQNIRLQGYIAPREYGADMLAFQHQMAEWIASGRISICESVFEGLERTPEAFISIFTGSIAGKILVRL
ncbi:NADP-dependent oxidoreductase [Sphingobium sp. TA15]|uniref:Putative NADP-dependent oxidoreductase n=1 Tax=Sphingobium indicum (strain DSM 16413 / CCM 7287 / MTCC 6362 / UT26 / NBRC 101211 / UT26S) TaxID=452662 RepID=D4Z662_SPHIU|nr:NADP-dependent oxidoreductase [Sphingobium indicum]BAI98094.1 putative NADP-dependent oxidoreductase [Sphingobium indicum UT26S]BDD67471.1 NADP-dependent oxidoreductase [Sphingobium sp. TA15]